MSFLPYSAIFTMNIHPIAFSIGPIDIRWYGICFATGMFLFTHFFSSDKYIRPQKILFENLLSMVIACILLGAKIGYVVFYTSPKIWLKALFALNGLSFHGGVLGACVSGYICYKKYGVETMWTLLDRTARWVPWSLLVGRIGNFLNSELLGRPTGLDSFGVIFPYGDRLLIPRHPSQLYEAFGEGIILGWIMYYADYHYGKHPKFLSGIFLISYGLIRLMLEYYRMPDHQIGFLTFGLTLGQWLCICMIFAGLYVLHLLHLSQKQDLSYENLS
ncbi:MAG: prolipoprotein diacylglyceryl transferase [Gammaproteobacteria bacterium]|nr:prolipoprotein diacylglyceryl transferase [Gammaproteobacteria bacterium]